MSIERLRQAAEKLKRERAASLAKDEVDQAKSRANIMFQEAWVNAYPGEVLFTTEEFRLAAKRNLGLLGPPFLERCWDFYLVEFKNMDKDDSYVFAAEILLYAALGNDEMVITYLTDGASLMSFIIQAHRDLFQILEYEAKQGMPFTPPITLMELHQLAGISYPKLTGERKAKKWESPDPKHQRLRRWKSRNPEMQRTVLTACRQKQWNYILLRK